MDFVTHLQGNVDSDLTPLFLVHAISGLSLPYLHLKSFRSIGLDGKSLDRPVYGINSPIYISHNYSVPKSFEKLATLYITKIKTIQAHGPYLLGGWSFGGMLAVKMAEALLAQGETVLRVIILDSGNPETFPAFKSEAEHKALTEATYNQIIAISTALHTDGRNSPDNTSSESRTSSESELNEDDESSLVDNIHLAKLIRRHISDAFLVLSNQGQRGFLSEKLDTHVVLIKCKTTLQIDNTALLNRSAYMLGLMRDKFMD
ncbi:hypothetical protein NPX13_g1382 [Xylaria arbuscula]|uniref:Thioesterase domain-containing protein n=1 Tax=Xylaria arbuscula TaxID=114810 RepID=A0A9W8NL60_9PEZI|nr:hypothetical protein NPX13_g1382 [Xylaria arbuscula]